MLYSKNRFYKFVYCNPVKRRNVQFTINQVKPYVYHSMEVPTFEHMGRSVFARDLTINRTSHAHLQT